MRFYLVEPNYFKMRFIVKAATSHGAIMQVVKWIRENKGVYIMPHEFEVEREYFPEQIKDAIWI